MFALTAQRGRSLCCEGPKQRILRRLGQAARLHEPGEGQEAMMSSRDWDPAEPFPKGFHEVARVVYRDDPYWIPEEPAELEASFGPGNPYFRSCTAWLHFEPGRTRLAGFFNPGLSIDGRRVAYFGYWETLDDLEANQRVFGSFEDWARSKGACAVYGPINFSTFGQYRVRLDHFEAGCFLGEPYNPPYYPAILEALGYRLDRLYMSITGRLEDALANLQGKMPSPFEAAAALGVKLVRLSPELWLENLDRFYALSDVIYSRNFGYTPIDFATFQRGFGRSFAERFCPKTSVLALDTDGEVAGFVVSFPDYSPLCRQGARDPIPVRALRYKDHFPLLESPMGIAKSGGVHPRHRKEGLYWILNYAIALWARSEYVYAAGATMPADNPSLKMAREVFTRPTDLVRSYGLFFKELA